MTNDEQYVPTDEQMQADWHAYITTPDEENYYYDALSSEEADARWSRWLAAHDARVRRDAAREALDGLARESMGAFKSPLAPPDPRSWAEMTGAVEWYRDTHYHEETP